jgi:predicted AAA+ superfamily ATPase
MLLKDVARTFSIDDIGSLEKCAKYLAVTSGALMSYDKVSKVLNISFQTLKKYLNAMEKSYLIKTVTPYFRNKAKEIAKQPKVYFLDTGLRNIIANSFNSEVDGKLFENYVLSELIKLDLAQNIKYWRTKAKAEVDFIIENNEEIIPIEVKLQAEPNKIKRSLRSFINTYNPKRAFVVIYKGKMGELNINGCKVVFIDIMGLCNILKEM